MGYNSGPPPGFNQWVQHETTRRATSPSVPFPGGGPPREQAVVYTKQELLERAKRREQSAIDFAEAEKKAQATLEVARKSFPDLVDKLIKSGAAQDRFLVEIRNKRGRRQEVKRGRGSNSSRRCHWREAEVGLTVRLTEPPVTVDLLSGGRIVKPAAERIPPKALDYSWPNDYTSRRRDKTLSETPIKLSPEQHDRVVMWVWRNAATSGHTSPSV